MLSVSVRLESSARSFIKPSPEDDIFNRHGGSGPGPGRTVAVSAIRPDPWNLLFSDPAADEAAAKEGRGVPGRPHGRRPDRPDQRHLRADHEVERQVGPG